MSFFADVCSPQRQLTGSPKQTDVVDTHESTARAEGTERVCTTSMGSGHEQDAAHACGLPVGLQRLHRLEVSFQIEEMDRAARVANLPRARASTVL